MTRIIFLIAVIVIGAAEYTEHTEPQFIELNVYQVDLNGNYEIDIHGVRYSPSAECKEVDEYRKHRCLVHCALMGYKNGSCQNVEPACKCEGRGNFGQEAYKKKFDSGDIQTKTKSENKSKYKKQAKEKEIQSHKKNMKNKVGKKVAGTHVEIVFESSEDRLGNPIYNSDESKEK